MERMAPTSGPSIRARTPTSWTVRRYADTMTTRRLEAVLAREKLPRVHSHNEGEIVVLDFPVACPEEVISTVREKLASDGYHLDPPEAA